MHASGKQRPTLSDGGGKQQHTLLGASGEAEDDDSPEQRTAGASRITSLVRARSSTRVRKPTARLENGSGQVLKAPTKATQTKSTRIRAGVALARAIGGGGPGAQALALAREAREATREPIRGSVTQQRHPLDNEQRFLIAEELSKLPIFTDVSPEMVKGLAMIAREESYQKEQTIVSEGCLGNSLLVILRGSVQLFVDGMQVSRLQCGDFFGETCFVGLDQHWQATLKAEKVCTICEIMRSDFLNVLEGFPEEKQLFQELEESNQGDWFARAGILEARLEILKGLSERALRLLNNNFVHRIYCPGMEILTQGDTGDQLYIVARGEVSVEIANKVVRRLEVTPKKEAAARSGSAANATSSSNSGKPDSKEPTGDDDGSSSKSPRRLAAAAAADDGEPKRGAVHVHSTAMCFGELGLLGINDTRNATVRAQSYCQVRVLYREVFLKNIEEARGETKGNVALGGITGVDFLNGRSAKVASMKNLKQVQIFKESGCQEEFLMFLTEHLEDRIYIAGQTIIDEGAEDACMYLLAQGTVHVKRAGTVIATLTSGTSFGEMTFFGLSQRRTSTVSAAIMCLVELLHPGVVMRGLELFPDERRSVLNMIASLQGQSVSGQAALDAGATPQDMFKRVLKRSVLGQTSDAFIENISQVATDRIYAPGDTITIEGHKSSSMFVMGSGRAGVFQRNPTAFGENVRRKGALGDASSKRCRVGTVNSGDICGELSMLGVLEYRLATIEAETICTMWEITEEDCMRVIHHHMEARRHFSNIIANHLGHTVLLRVTNLPLFSQFENAVRTYLGLYSDQRVYFPMQKIAREGKAGSHCFVINIGSATLDKKGVVIKTYMSGDHFGADVMLAISKTYLGTFIAYQTCHIICISRLAFTQVLEKYPSVKAKEAMKQSQAQEAAELRLSTTRVATRKRVWKRYQNWVAETLDKEEGEESKHHGASHMSEDELLATSFNHWRQRAEDQRRCRDRMEEERVRSDKAINRWLEKKQAALERVRLRKEEETAPSIGSRTPRTARSVMSRDVSSGTLPPVMVPEEAERSQLEALMKKWPAPKPSPHYKLRLWDILAETMDSRADTTPLLPLLTLAQEGQTSEAPVPAAPASARTPRADRLPDADLGLSARGGVPKKNVRREIMQHSIDAAVH